MAFNAHVVYVTDGRKVRYLRQTQAVANADAAADAELTAHVGAVATPDNVIPGWFFNVDESFSADAPDDATQFTAWKQELSQKALMVDDAIRSHWANQTRRQSSWETARTLDDARRLDNTFDWSRLWIGLPWLEILKAEGDADALALDLLAGVNTALTRAGVEEVMNQTRAELPNHDHIYFWYAAHEQPGQWHGWLDRGEVYITNADGTGAIWKPARYAGIVEATRTAIVVGHYGAARNYAAGIGV